MNIFTAVYAFLKQLIIKHRKSVSFLILLVEATLANYLAFALRFDGAIPQRQFSNFLMFLPLLLLVRSLSFLYFGLHRNLWRYSSVPDLIQIVKSALLGSLVFGIAVRYGAGNDNYPRTIYILDSMLLIMMSGGARLFIRVFREYLQAAFKGKRLLIIGAGDAAEMIVRDIRSNEKYGYSPIGFMDDDPAKRGLTMHGLPIFGPCSHLADVIAKEMPDEILIAIPSADRQLLQTIFGICKQYHLPVKTLPRLRDIIDGKVTVSQIRPLSLEDLLQREPILPENREIHSYLEGKVVLVTGAGGSIGSELSRQILLYRPACLMLLDRYENGLFEIDRELQSTVRTLDSVSGDTAPRVMTIVGDMTNRSDMERLYRIQRPEIVFHAAAHKHVPLMEMNPMEAVRNNVFGTLNMLECSRDFGVENFILISTDKAVNPTNVMGATKRIAELMALAMDEQSATRYTAVRFGNVLGSNGSVVHIFRDQLKKGGPLTVTHPEIKRFFMLIPEAVHLVLTAASIGQGGEIFVLDMGEQILISELAENLIRLSGFVPHQDIRIEYTGLRPGEKLYEELFDENELPSKAGHEKLYIADPKIRTTYDEIMLHVGKLRSLLDETTPEKMIEEIQRIVPNYRKK